MFFEGMLTTGFCYFENLGEGAENIKSTFHRVVVQFKIPLKKTDDEKLGKPKNNWVN